ADQSLVVAIFPGEFILFHIDDPTRCPIASPFLLENILSASMNQESVFLLCHLQGGLMHAHLNLKSKAFRLYPVTGPESRPGQVHIRALEPVDGSGFALISRSPCGAASVAL